jgi:hypothetical protein
MRADMTVPASGSNCGGWVSSAGSVRGGEHSLDRKGADAHELAAWARDSISERRRPDVLVDQMFSYTRLAAEEPG